MAKPWERYAAPAPSGAKPWEQFRAAPGSPEDDARRLKQGGRTYAEQNAIAEREAAEYQAKIDAGQPVRQLGRALALGGRAITRGAVALPDIVVSPITSLINYLGEKGETPQSLITGQRERYFPRLKNLTESADALSDALGAPQPETPAERLSSDVTSAVAGAPGGVALGRQLAQRAPGVVSRIGQTLAERPGLQIASAATGAGAAGSAREAGVGPAGQVVAGLGGALAPSAPAIATAGLSGALSGTVPAARKELAREAQRQGITLTPAQLSDSRFIKFAQSALRSVPFTGAQGRFQRQTGDFNRALARTIGEDADNLGAEVFSRAKARHSAKFDELTSRNALRVDNDLLRNLSDIADSAKISPDIARDVEAAIDRLYAQATTGNGGVVIPGRAYQAFDSELGSIIKNGGPPAHFLGQVQSTVRNAMDRSIAPEDVQAWRQLRREYGNRKALTPLAAKAEEGQIRPAQVLGAATSTKAGKEAMATGRSALAPLSRIGQLMKEPPSSGTAERATVSGLLGGAAYIDPVTGGLTAGALNLLSRGLDSRRLAQLMIRENPGMTLDTALEVIKRSAVPAAIVTQQTQEPR